MHALKWLIRNEMVKKELQSLWTIRPQKKDARLFINSDLAATNEMQWEQGIPTTIWE
jgi:hypothetical protein